jgi:hypothetical protein
MHPFKPKKQAQKSHVTASSEESASLILFKQWWASCLYKIAVLLYFHSVSCKIFASFNLLYIFIVKATLLSWLSLFEM